MLSFSQSIGCTGRQDSFVITWTLRHWRALRSSWVEIHWRAWWILKVRLYASYHTKSQGGISTDIFQGLMMQTARFGPVKHLCPRPLEVDKRGRKECWTTGCRVSKQLQACGHCGVAKYCSRSIFLAGSSPGIDACCCRDHQKQAWRRHKSFCGKYAAERPD